MTNEKKKPPVNAEAVPLICRVCGPVRGAVAALPRVALGGLRLLACPRCRRVLAVKRRDDAAGGKDDA
ncbi:hypothetical protein LCGC14_2914040 [marine sediment metagenome]|uniref:Uncharacterized protein n=1 Tax=marine sediment metagenome TaxID=412755 RepID=A0A0F8XR63_9ZZZZ